MDKHHFHPLKKQVVYLAVIALVVPVLLALADTTDHPAKTTHKVFIAFGFHVNLYHSFRNDTNDESGFGQDITVIRHIIRTLDRLNAEGVPVKGVWDFDNLFSLQEILPQYAPDIIDDIRRRVNENGDEVILMSYNNGLVSAMTPRELDDAVRWSISNPWHSGVRDLFGKYSPIVRPQEMMTTPGNFDVYKRHGIQAAALYYSSTPFDAFRVFSRPLSRAEAHNPLLYRHPKTGEEMVILPTYHIGDLVDHVSLKHWVGELRDLQSSGALNRDALIFINYDADSVLWRGVDLPWILKWLPNTDGIGGLVDEVRDLDQVEFTTLGDYLAHHPPVGSFHFSQDTADGSFNGYNSWAEKAGVSGWWTSIDRSRRVCAAALKAKAQLNDVGQAARLENLVAFADIKRLRALSTTHFGMATPYVARQREQVMAELMEGLDSNSRQIEYIITEGLQEYLKRQSRPRLENRIEKPGLIHLDTLMVLGTKNAGHHFISLPRPKGYGRDMHPMLVRPDGKVLQVRHFTMEDGPTPRLTLYITDGPALTDGIYHLYAAVGNHAPSGRQITLDDHVMSNGRLEVRFNRTGLEGIYLDGVQQADAGSLMPWLKWRDRIFSAQGTVQPAAGSTDGNTRSLRVAGPWPGPVEYTRSNGWMDYRFDLVPGKPYLVVQANLRYPSTEKRDIIKAAAPGLTRRSDLKWQETAPAEIKFTPLAGKDAPVRVLKQNYLDVATEYALDYYRFSDQNLDLDAVNNHITASYVGLVAGGYGVGIAMDTTIRSNFAFAPLKIRHHNGADMFSARANPFGTYHGRQLQPPTWGNGNGYDVTLLTGEQFASAAPTYNGTSTRFNLMLAFFNGPHMPEEIKRDLVDFAHPPMVISSFAPPVPPAPSHPLPTPQGFVAAYKNGTVHFNWDGDAEPDSHYRILCGSRSGSYDTVYPAVGNGLNVNKFVDGTPFIEGRRYYAAIEKVSANGRVSLRAPEIHFTIDRVEEKPPKVPLALEFRVLWANLVALLASLGR